MNDVRVPNGLRLEQLRREHPRRRFECGETAVDAWLATKALQHQTKHLSVTKVLLDATSAIAGYYTLGTGQVDFNDLPIELSRHLPRRVLPIAVLAWLGVAKPRQGQGVGRLLLAQALRDCWEAGHTFPFVAVILDCINASAKTFYRR
ncbi:MAG TPA: GNAT family N-acetyltransferase, partial [Pirellulales bacterium]|nr:GNAT family N-acetyltransferase [Pirellulales bacterium]